MKSSTEKIQIWKAKSFTNSLESRSPGFDQILFGTKMGFSYMKYICGGSFHHIFTLEKAGDLRGTPFYVGST